MIRVAMGPRIRDSRNQSTPLRFLPWASPALMRARVPQPTNQGAGVEVKAVKGSMERSCSWAGFVGRRWAQTVGFGLHRLERNPIVARVFFTYAIPHWSHRSEMTRILAVLPWS